MEERHIHGCRKGSMQEQFPQPSERVTSWPLRSLVIVVIYGSEAIEHIKE